MSVAACVSIVTRRTRNSRKIVRSPVASEAITICIPKAHRAALTTRTTEQFWFLQRSSLRPFQEMFVLNYELPSGQLADAYSPHQQRQYLLGIQTPRLEWYLENSLIVRDISWRYEKEPELNSSFMSMAPCCVSRIE